MFLKRGFIFYRKLLLLLIFAVFFVTREGVPEPVASETVLILFEDGARSSVSAELRDLLQPLAQSEADEGQLEEIASQQLTPYYVNRGFFHSEVDSVRILDSQLVEIHIYVNPGCRFSIGSLNYELNGGSAQTEWQKPLNGEVAAKDQNPEEPDIGLQPDDVISFYGEGDVFDTDLLQEEFRRYVRHYASLGFPLAAVEITAFDIQPSACDVHIDAEIIPGERLHAAGARVGGLEQHDPDFVEKATYIRENDLITPELFERGRKSLERTDLFHEVSEGDIYLNDGDPYIYYDVTERRANNFDLMFGYAPGQRDGYDVIGRGSMLIRNVGWVGSRMNINYERLQNRVTRLHTGYGRQWIGGAPLGGSMEFRFLQQDTSYQVRELEIAGTYMWNPAREISFRLSREGISANPDPALPVRVLDGQSYSAGAGFSFDNTDSRLSPTEGMMFDIHVASIFRRISDPRAEELQSRGSMFQQSVRSSFTSYISPLSRQVIALGFHGASLESPEYSETDLMRLGGSNSIRGYHEEQFHVARYGWGELEYRYLLDPYSHGFVFAAAGVYDMPRMVGDDHGGASDWIYSGGFGFRYRTPIGIMQFTYAVSSDDPLHNGKVHFNLSADF